ncbi:MAG: hypothetical protein G5663_06990 [Serratia symbiotica]|nr:hypothetical protein [Serratia symbiotica]
MMHEMVDYILLTQPIAASEGIMEVVINGIVILSDSSGIPFGGDRMMAAHRVNFRDQCDFKLEVGFRYGYEKPAFVYYFINRSTTI